MKRAKTKTRYVFCIRNKGCEDLALRKVYEVIPDESATKDSYIRVTDESGEDYLYPEDCFVDIELPQAAESAMAHAA